MRTMFAASLALVSLSAFAACPNLAGHYVNCSATSSVGEAEAPRSATITQTLTAGVTTYDGVYIDADGNQSETTVIADGQSRTSQDEDGSTVSFKATCVGATLVAEASLKDNQGQNLTSKIVIQKVNGAYVEKTDIVADGQTYTQTVTCK